MSWHACRLSFTSDCVRRVQACRPNLPRPGPCAPPSDHAHQPTTKTSRLGRYRFKMEQRTCGSKEPTDSSCCMTSNDGSQVVDDASWTPVNRSLDERQCEVMGGRPGNISIDEAEQGSRDRNNQLHVDTSTDQVYAIGEAQQTRHYIAPVRFNQSMQSMRIHIASLLPKELITDEYGEMMPVEAVSSRHLAKLQSAIWHELPAAAAFTFMGADDDGPGHRVITAQAVYWIGNIMSKGRRDVPSLTTGGLHKQTIACLFSTRRRRSLAILRFVSTLESIPITLIRDTKSLSSRSSTG